MVAGFFLLVAAVLAAIAVFLPRIALALAAVGVVLAIPFLASRPAGDDFLFLEHLVGWFLIGCSGYTALIAVNALVARRDAARTPPQPPPPEIPRARVISG